MQILASPANDRDDAGAQIVAYLGDGADRIDLPYSLTGTRYLWAQTERSPRPARASPQLVSNVGHRRRQRHSARHQLRPTGDSVIIQYSANGTTWHDPPFVSGDLYMRQKIGTSGTYARHPNRRRDRVHWRRRIAGLRAIRLPPRARRAALRRPATASPSSWSMLRPRTRRSGGCRRPRSRLQPLLIGSWSHAYPASPATPGRRSSTCGCEVNHPLGARCDLEARAGVRLGFGRLLARGYPAARVSFRAGANGYAMMAGLNSDPPPIRVTHRSISRSAAGQRHRVDPRVGCNWISGFGAFTPSTQFAIDYDGATVRYYKTTRSCALVPLAGAKSTSIRASTRAVRSRTSSSRRRLLERRPGNLLSLDTWAVGSSGFTAIGPFPGVITRTRVSKRSCSAAPAARRSIPTVKASPLWECRPDGGNDASGGFVDQLDLYGVDHTKPLRMACWFRWNAAAQASGSLYIGPSAGGETHDLVGAGGGVNLNPYAIQNVPSALGLVADKWYLFVSVVHGSGYTGGASGQSGIWDPAAGTRVVAGTDFRFAVGAISQTIRAHPFYYTTTSARIWLSARASTSWTATSRTFPSCCRQAGCLPTGIPLGQARSTCRRHRHFLGSGHERGRIPASHLAAEHADRLDLDARVRVRNGDHRHRHRPRRSRYARALSSTHQRAFGLQWQQHLRNRCRSQRQYSVARCKGNSFAIENYVVPANTAKTFYLLRLSAASAPSQEPTAGSTMFCSRLRSSRR